MTLTQALALLGLLTDTVTSQQQRINALVAQVQALQEAPDGQ